MQEKLSYSELKLSIEDFVIGESSMENLLLWREDIDEILCLGNEIITPEVHIKQFEIENLEKDRFSIDGVEFHCGKKIAFQLKDAENMAIFVCTVGKGVTEYYKYFMKQNEPLKAYFVDMLGSISVEKSMNIFQQQFSDKKNEEGCRITNRYSPGYCEWPLLEQKKLFNLFTGDTCGITLTESCLMLPAKSISGVIGVGTEVKFSEHECALCNFRKCIYRKKNQR
ncbi:MAG: methionine synthase [Candidatus Azobacteroides sp.]|nr:methionine synthase [Candidatus Azobacteroides sp.]